MLFKAQWVLDDHGVFHYLSYFADGDFRSCLGPYIVTVAVAKSWLISFSFGWLQEDLRRAEQGRVAFGGFRIGPGQKESEALPRGREG